MRVAVALGFVALSAVISYVAGALPPPPPPGYGPGGLSQPGYTPGGRPQPIHVPAGRPQPIHRPSLGGRPPVGPPGLRPPMGFRPPPLPPQGASPIRPRALTRGYKAVLPGGGLRTGQVTYAQGPGGSSSLSSSTFVSGMGRR